MAESLFNTRIVAAALPALPALTDAQLRAAGEWAARASAVALDLQNESQLEQDFNRLVIQDLLGYAAEAPGRPGTMRAKQSIDRGIVDVALGRFDEREAVIVAPLELKGPRVPLDRIMPGRFKTPVQQAWDYAMDAPGARWVLLSNMKELRLYAFGHGRQTYEHFDLKRIDQPAERDRLRLLLAADRLLGGATADLLARSAQADREVTNQLYRDYKQLRAQLMSFAADRHPAIKIEDRIRCVQTLLDRVLFVAFAEDRQLLPARSLKDAVETTNRYNPQPKWTQLRTLFGWVDSGAPPHDIPRYNGGLFAADPLIDGLDLPDHLVEQFGALADYDFASEVSVTILGHIFEQSITDIENEKAAAGLEAPPPASRKKREGVVYTPDFITRFIVEQTIGRHLKDIEEGLLAGYGKREANDTITWRKTSAEADYWSAYLDRLAALRILDPACGSGAFLIAAFNFLNAEQKRVRDRLSELRPGILAHLSPNADVEIITNNLFGVDVNAESVEITKLALWLQTARRDRALESLDGNIQHGNSLVDDPAFHPRPFDWDARFGDRLGKFDIVIGNPPYVRMELVKPIKPHLERRFAVASDRADLYAYFFELGVKLLKPGGRLGFISSSTFFRTGSGKPLRAYLAQHTAIESVIDFGDLQVFEGVTTYPAIVTLRKDVGASEGALSYLGIAALPDDLARTFELEARAMPRTRLTDGTWRFESDALDAIRGKLTAGRPTLAQVYGAPLYGIKTGLNRAFILSRVERDAIVARAAHTPGDRSAELLKPFLIGENCKRWHVESDDLWVLYIPKNAIDIAEYPAARDHLAPFREQLEKRATRQNWWELQQPQANYLPHFAAPKVLYNRFADRPQFSFYADEILINDAPYIIPSADEFLVALLNSRAAWFVLSSFATRLQNGYFQLLGRHVEPLPIPAADPADREALRQLGASCGEAAATLHALKVAVLHRLRDVASGVGEVAVLRDWPALSFAALQAVLAKRFKATIPVADRDEWERWYEGKRAEAAALSRRIADAEAEIDARVYRLFDLTETEIAAIEDALAVASPALSLKSYEAISAVEGLELSDAARRRLAAAA